MAKRIKNEFDIIGEIGAGGMATVYQAIQKSLDRPVAVKELKKAYQADPTVVQRFEREARLAASFQHENIVHIYDYAPMPDCCIIMEYVDGITLNRLIDEIGQIPADVGVMIALQVASALEYAHTRGLIHRDIKPGNIMIKRNGEVKVMDFGIAWVKNQESLTMPGMLMGTPSYMSPEQILGNALDVRSDIFSFGIVLYEMFTGLKPFQDEHTASISAKIVKGTFLPPRSINSELPRSIQRIIKKCLKNKPHQRFASMQEVSQALGKKIRGTDKPTSLRRISDFLVALNLVEAPPPDQTVVIYRTPGMGKFTKTLVITGGILLLLCAAAGYYSWEKAKTAVPRTDRAVPSLVQTPSVVVSAPTASDATTPALPAMPEAVSMSPADRSSPQ